MHRITSREHPVVKQFVKLQKSAQLRKKCGATILDGVHLIHSCLFTSGTPVVPNCLVVSESGQNNKEIKSLLEVCIYHKKTQVFLVIDSLFQRISPVKTPTGILAQITIPEPEEPPISTNRDSIFCVLLEAIQDPGNLGTILRSAAAANVTDIYLSKDCADAWSPKTLRAGMGAHFLLRIHTDCNLVEIVRHFRGQILATSPRAPKSLYQSDLTKPTAFIFGNEGAGLSNEILRAANEIISIPMPGKTESLNAATAVTICLFEKVRQDIY
ncbi:RNA methyltransferase, TrmH family [Nitrosomonas aestuarii]|uniref:RNA methyltransferase, TrmH family n=1 Tax=Nitrosomonas aestuarii TaxID=52441 RepID=A0A1I4DUS5_9PROT|nr:RNA methyltransferase [Nitrosomonas aestuarii]SFK97135.1 RNA methyltransferase, TrmH family [Nitrosomonas aestuarii]